ncbi:hypothetical protein M5689_024770 [Euphorbia peplus]|nr:hypothetical protein M5689_024770 [Euphorbia peplus]
MDKPRDFAEKVALLCWSLWNNRNNVVWNRKSSLAGVIMQAVKSLFEAWKAAQVGGSVVVQSAVQPYVVWVRPPPGMLKMNVDAALFSNPISVGFGFVLRDENGAFMAAKNGGFLWNSDPSLVEALSIREALSWIKDRGLSSVLIESDSLVVVQSMASSLEVVSSFNAIVKDCIDILNELSNSSIAFVKRTANSAARCLARSIHLINCRGKWSVPPEFLCSALLLDS